MDEGESTDSLRSRKRFYSSAAFFASTTLLSKRFKIVFGPSIVQRLTRYFHEYIYISFFFLEAKSIAENNEKILQRQEKERRRHRPRGTRIDPSRDPLDEGTVKEEGLDRQDSGSKVSRKKRTQRWKFRDESGRRKIAGIPRKSLGAYERRRNAAN